MTYKNISVLRELTSVTCVVVWVYGTRLQLANYDYGIKTGCIIYGTVLCVTVTTRIFISISNFWSNAFWFPPLQTCLRIFTMSVLKDLLALGRLNLRKMIFNKSEKCVFKPAPWMAHILKMLSFKYFIINLCSYIHSIVNTNITNLAQWKVSNPCTGPEVARSLRLPDFKTVGTRRW